MAKMPMEYDGEVQSLTLSSPTNCSVGSNYSYYDDNNIYLCFRVDITTTGTNASVKLPFNVKPFVNAASGYSSSSLTLDYINSFSVRGNAYDTILFIEPKSKYIYVQCVVPRE